MLKPTLAGLAVSVLLASQGLAADMSLPPPPQPDFAAAPAFEAAAYDWNGFYAGVLLGYGTGNSSATSGGFTTNTSPSGALAGLTAGANMQMDQFVFGVEGDVGWSGQSATATCAGSASTCGADLDWNGSLRARAGLALDPMLLYVTGGLAVARANFNVTPADVGTTGTNSDTYLGWTVGGGVEAALTEQLSAKAEYTYSDFGSRIAPAGTLAAGTTDTSLTSHAVKFGLNYRF